MDRNEQEYNKHSNQKETERILQRRDREKYLEELSELESEEASYWSKIFQSFWPVVLELALFSGFNIWVKWYTLSWIRPEYLKYIDIGQTVSFIVSLLFLVCYVWKMSDIKAKIVKVERKVCRLDRELSRQ